MENVMAESEPDLLKYAWENQKIIQVAFENYKAFELFYKNCFKDIKKENSMTALKKMAQGLGTDAKWEDIKDELEVMNNVLSKLSASTQCCSSFFKLVSHLNKIKGSTGKASMKAFVVYILFYFLHDDLEKNENWTELRDSSSSFKVASAILATSKEYQGFAPSDLEPDKPSPLEQFKDFFYRTPMVKNSVRYSFAKDNPIIGLLGEKRPNFWTFLDNLMFRSDSYLCKYFVEEASMDEPKWKQFKKSFTAIELFKSFEYDDAKTLVTILEYIKTKEFGTMYSIEVTHIVLSFLFWNGDVDKAASVDAWVLSRYLLNGDEDVNEETDKAYTEVRSRPQFKLLDEKEFGIALMKLTDLFKEAVRASADQVPAPAAEEPAADPTAPPPPPAAEEPAADPTAPPPPPAQPPATTAPPPGSEEETGEGEDTTESPSGSPTASFVGCLKEELTEFVNQTNTGDFDGTEFKKQLVAFVDIIYNNDPSDSMLQSSHLTTLGEIENAVSKSTETVPRQCILRFIEHTKLKKSMKSLEVCLVALYRLYAVEISMSSFLSSESGEIEQTLGPELKHNIAFAEQFERNVKNKPELVYVVGDQVFRDIEMVWIICNSSRSVESNNAPKANADWFVQKYSDSPLAKVVQYLMVQNNVLVWCDFGIERWKKYVIGNPAFEKLKNVQLQAFCNDIFSASTPPQRQYFRTIAGELVSDLRNQEEGDSPTEETAPAASLDPASATEEPPFVGCTKKELEELINETNTEDYDGTELKQYLANIVDHYFGLSASDSMLASKYITSLQEFENYVPKLPDSVPVKCLLRFIQHAKSKKSDKSLNLCLAALYYLFGISINTSFFMEIESGDIEKKLGLELKKNITFVDHFWTLVNKDTGVARVVGGQLRQDIGEVRIICENRRSVEKNVKPISNASWFVLNYPESPLTEVVQYLIVQNNVLLWCDYGIARWKEYVMGNPTFNKLPRVKLQMFCSVMFSASDFSELQYFHNIASELVKGLESGEGGVAPSALPSAGGGAGAGADSTSSDSDFSDSEGEEPPPGPMDPGWGNIGVAASMRVRSRFEDFEQRRRMVSASSRSRVAVFGSRRTFSGSGSGSSSDSDSDLASEDGACHCPQAAETMDARNADFRKALQALGLGHGLGVGVGVGAGVSRASARSKKARTKARSKARSQARARARARAQRPA